MGGGSPHGGPNAGLPSETDTVIEHKVILQNFESFLVPDLYSIAEIIFTMGETADGVQASVLHGVKDLKLVSPGHVCFEIIH